MMWKDFVKANYDKVRSLPNKERFKKLSEMYQKNVKGGNMYSDISTAMSGMSGMDGFDFGGGSLNMVKQMHKLELLNHRKNLTKSQAKQLKHLHKLDGGGFFDDLWDGIKSVGSTALQLAPHIAMSML